ncbi:hypothetical protein MPC4_220055 [Methylocella tundrae]|uniref:Uncharacterized protein n=1 Tax=Methylocella tundrae TaxID=227605 RepID=A0A8B6M6B0_METTU|nr:hypothetical protein MPC1_3880006 [Methylocella tundrae]VTZ50325.1 hypothetical protein MPC4_220055 [Methylocella tundrae]
MRGSIRLSIHKPIAFEAHQRFGAALCIHNTEAGAIVITELKFGKVAMQVGFTYCVITRKSPFYCKR